MSDNVLQLEVPALHCDVNLKSTAMQGPRAALLIRRVRYAAYFSGGRVDQYAPNWLYNFSCWRAKWLTIL